MSYEGSIEKLRKDLKEDFNKIYEMLALLIEAERESSNDIVVEEKILDDEPIPRVVEEMPIMEVVEMEQELKKEDTNFLVEQPFIKNAAMEEKKGSSSSLTLDVHVDSRTNPFKGGEDDVNMDSFIFEDAQQLVPMKLYEALKMSKPINLTLRHLLGISAIKGATHIQWRTISSRWKANKKIYNFYANCSYEIFSYKSIYCNLRQQSNHFQGSN